MEFIVISITLLIVILVTIVAVLLSVSSKAEEDYYKIKEQNKNISSDEDIHKKIEDK